MIDGCFDMLVRQKLYDDVFRNRIGYLSFTHGDNGDSDWLRKLMHDNADQN